MSTLTISDLKYISREDLAQKLQNRPAQPLPSNTTTTTTSPPTTTTTAPPTTTATPSIAIIDVRDSDHIGGHIRGSTWIPSSTLDYRTPQLVRELQGVQTVVFHCALSQQRGPSAALRYLRERERLSGGVGAEKGAAEMDVEGDGQRSEGKGQQVLVLRGGFTEWQEKFGEDEKLTEGWQKDIWEFGQ